ncbi:preprotein translocase subunit SecE [Rhodococcus triatomae]|uniref:Protein translocase subunit SecE n=1 Tax=Rhodococcus triatomae TaxID=300028 RepID=A0A1G8JCQ8_9NOCA|nr:preprotein translocase subunit SecE [Rhodococcus triatomae]QNG19752.1 preprotein translocase subunit SecE [Rhodococcus triatomae]QNG24332.1 preprotein translocase subunit SecE [Rhodococcus triatomae]SDI28863.1 preprotein translocase subunit SecE [Rhodococcus triatomae]
MSEERAGRDGGASGSKNPKGADDNAADATRGVPSGKPTGKRPARRRSEDAASSAGKAVSSGKLDVDAGKAGKATQGTKPRKENIFKRLRRFLREVMAELRKVIWPNRKQMITYTSVVLVFLAFMVTFIGLLDLAVIQGVTWLFD